MSNFKKIIDMETLELFSSVSDCAKKLGCSSVNISKCILLGHRAKGRRLEYHDFWLYQMTNKEKENYSKKSNIFFCVI